MTDTRWLRAMLVVATTTDARRDRRSTAARARLRRSAARPHGCRESDRRRPARRASRVSGTGYSGMVGQQRLHGYDVDWPRVDALANYTRTMNWDARTMKEEFDRKPGLNPASWKYGVGWIGGTPLQQNRTRCSCVNGKPTRWHMDGAGGHAGGRAAGRSPSAGSWSCG